MALLLVFEEHFQSVFFFMHASESLLEFLHNKNTQQSFTKVDQSTYGPITLIVGLNVIGLFCFHTHSHEGLENYPSKMHFFLAVSATVFLFLQVQIITWICFL